MGELRFRIGEEVQPKIVEYKDFSTSIFCEVYAKTYTILNGIITQSANLRESREKGMNTDRLNNIIAFSGDRGSGKTSCMLSLLKDLCDNFPVFQRPAREPRFNIPEDIRFLSVDLIDPSFFDKKHNIIEIVLGKMFAAFRQDTENRQISFNSDYADRKRKLIGEFQKVKENLDHLWKGSETNESLDDLIALSAGMELKTNIRDLVQSYLEYFENAKGFLILPIDDIDLHTQCAYEMAEQIRKYFIQPNVIVLMAVKLDQLKNIIYKHYHNVFQDIREEISDPIDLMAERYITKLIPYEHRLYLPDFYLNQREKLVIETKDKEAFTDNTVRGGVLKLIFQKTRYLFYNSAGRTSPIVPQNLRELVELLAMLNNMKDVTKDTDANGHEIVDGTRIYNQLLFKKYFIETWCAVHLEPDMHQFIRELPNKELIIRNKLVINFLTDKYTEETILNSSFYLDSNIYDIKNRPYNISLGDVLYVMDEIKTSFPEEITRDFIFALKTLYSIFLYEAYDQWCLEMDNNNPKISESQKKKEKNLKKDILEDYTDYEKIIAGAFVNSDLVKLLPFENNKDNRLTRKLSNIGILRDIQKKINTKTKIEIEELNLFELFYLTVQKKTEDKEYRKEDECYYDFETDFSKSSTFIFDATAIFFSLVRIYTQLRKKNEDPLSPGAMTDSLLKNIIIYKDMSLIYQIFKHCKDSGYSSIQSAISIRNTEVLEDLFSAPQDYRGGENFVHLVTLWHTFSMYNISSYLNNKEDKGDIRFDFFIVIVEACLKIHNKRTVYDLFEKIYKKQTNVSLNITVTATELEKATQPKNRGKGILSIISKRHSVLTVLLDKNTTLTDEQKEILEQTVKEKYKAGNQKYEDILKIILPEIKKRFEEKINN